MLGGGAFLDALETEFRGRAREFYDLSHRIPAKAPLTLTLSMSFVAADVSPLHLPLFKVRTDSRRLLRFRGSKREVLIRRNVSPSDGGRAGEMGQIILRIKTSRLTPEP